MTDSAAQQYTVLLVDDDPDDLLLVTRAFHRAGLTHKIVSARGGMEGMAYLAGNAPYEDRTRYPLPNLVLLDIKMPVVDGFELLRWIRLQKELAGLCVVMLTSSDEIRDVNRAYQLGATSFLVKPLDFWNAADLSRSLGKLLAKASQRSIPSRGVPERKEPEE
jgi:CheY-like chemotaxis protein